MEKILQGIECVIEREVFVKRLKENRPLRVKLGVDPTCPDLTFGHMVVFNKLRQFQELGHKAILIIGDFTTMIGDPSGRSTTRPVLTQEQVKQNAETYLEQAFKILDRNHTEVCYNSQWFQTMGFADALNLARKMTVARMLERDDFSKRYREGSSISIVEFLYPLLQGYDSIMVQSDIELGGTDQLFNLLVGRALQKEAGIPEQVVLCMPLLIGLDGVRKMSKSLGNYIAFNDHAKEMFGKIMSINDTVMWDYYKLLLEKDEETLAPLHEIHPMEVKKQLATALVTKFYTREEALYERSQFEQVFSAHKNPEKMPIFRWTDLAQDNTKLIDLLTATKLFSSKKEIRRLIAQGGVKIGGKRCTDPHHMLSSPESEIILQGGKRIFFKIISA